MAFRQYEGTIKPAPNFDPELAADELEKAMKGSGCDKNKVIDVIAKISNAQRQMVNELTTRFCYPIFFSDVQPMEFQISRHGEGESVELNILVIARQTATSIGDVCLIVTIIFFLYCKRDLRMDNFI